MQTQGLKLKLTAMAVLSVLSVKANAQLSNGDHRLDNVVNKSGQPILVIDNIVCENNQATDCDFITKKFYQQKGDVLDIRELDDAKLRLGRLLQFTDVNTRLEKDTANNRVTVIFEVLEASQTQYQWMGELQASKSDFSHCRDFYTGSTGLAEVCSRSSSRGKSAQLGGMVTNYNFLGTAKQFSVGLTGSTSELDQQVKYGTHGDFTYSWPESTQIDSNNNGIGFTFEYFDPHLFDSRDYFLRANLAHQRFNASGNLTYSFADQPTHQDDIDSDFNSTPFTIELGRRFGRHSFISVDMNRVSAKDPVNNRTFTNYGINYGWDSRDDTIFATEGSAFSTRYNHSKFDKNNTLSMSYSQYHSLSDDEILSWRVHGSHSRNRSRGIYDRYSPSSKTVSNYGFALTYTNINTIDVASGTRSGWFAEFGMNKTNGIEQGLADVNFKLEGGYIYQTSDMIYRFTLGLSSSKDL